MSRRLPPVGGLPSDRHRAPRTRRRRRSRLRWSCASRVFCDEQGVDPEEELDELDDEAIQIVGLDEPGVIATCRLRYLEQAVDASWSGWRSSGGCAGTGVGGRLLARAQSARRASAAPARWCCNAQPRAEAFYAANGYVAEGEHLHRGRDRARADDEGRSSWRDAQPQPEIRLDQLTGLRTILGAGARRPAVRLRPVADRADRGATPRTAPSARAARTAPRPRSGPTAPAGASRTRRAGGCGRSPTSTRRWPGRAATAPAGGSEADEGRRAAGDPLRASSRGREPDLFAASTGRGRPRGDRPLAPAPHLARPSSTTSELAAAVGGLARADARPSRERRATCS